MGDASRRDRGVTDTRRDPQRPKPGSKKGVVSVAGEHAREPGRLSAGWREAPSGKQQCQPHTGPPCTMVAQRSGRNPEPYEHDRPAQHPPSDVPRLQRPALLQL